MKLIFFGSGKFAVRILAAVHQHGIFIPLVVTQPDRARGRYLRLAPTPVKDYAVKHHLPLYQPEDINGPQSLSALAEVSADVFLVVSYGRILSAEVLRLPARMPVNVHASILPKYRGAAPIQWALIRGELETGITWIHMNEAMDQGDVIACEKMPILDFDDAISLDERLSTRAAELTPGLLNEIDAGRCLLTPQDHKQASCAPMIRKADGLVRWADSADQIRARFKGCAGWPGTYTIFRGAHLKILAMEISDVASSIRVAPGTIVKAENNTLEVACGKGCVLIHEVTPESHRRMDIRSFLAGHHVCQGDRLGV